MDLDDKIRWTHLATRVLLVLALLGVAASIVFSQDATATAALTSTTCPGSGCVQLAIAGRGGGAIQVTGGWTATLQFEATVDGTNWFAMPVSTVAASPAVVTSATANGRWTFGPSGFAQVRVRVSAFTSGTVSVAVRASAGALARSGSSGGSGSPGGVDTQLQYNDSGAFGGTAGLTWNATQQALTLDNTGAGSEPTKVFTITQQNEGQDGLFIGNANASTPSRGLDFLVMDDTSGWILTNDGGVKIQAAGATPLNPSTALFDIISDAKVDGPLYLSDTVQFLKDLPGGTTPMMLSGGDDGFGDAAIVITNSSNYSVLTSPGTVSIETTGDANDLFLHANGAGGGTGGQFTIKAPTGGADGRFDVYGNLRVQGGYALQTDTTDAHTARVQAYDVDGTAYKTFATLTNGNTPDFAIAPPAGGTVELTASTLIASNLHYPTTDGMPNQVMFTDGAGTLGFTSMSGGATNNDDGSVDPGQDANLSIGLTYVFDGSVWRRLTFGQQLKANSIPVTIASDQDVATASRQVNGQQRTQLVDAAGHVASVTFGALNVAVKGRTSAVDNSAVVTGQYGELTIGLGYVYSGSSWTRLTLGQTTMTASVPVTIASDQGALAVSAATLPLPTNAATSTKQSDGSQKTQIVDGSGNVIGATSNALDINIKSGNPTTITATQATGTNLHVVTDATSTTTVTQGTGTNLHTVVDSGAITATGSGNFTVVQGTGTNLHTVVDSGTITAVTAITNALPAGNNNIGDVDVASVTGNVTVVQPTGTNLHAVLDSGTTTVTQGTGTNLHTVVDSGTIAVTSAGLTNLDIALSALRDAIVGAGPKTLTDVVTQLTAIAASVATTANVAGTPGNAAPSQVEMSGARDATGTVQAIRATAQGAMVVQATPAVGLPLPPCNPVRRFNCQPKGY